MERRYRLVMTAQAGVPMMELARLLPQLRCSAETEQLPSLRACAAAGTPDMIIASCCEAEDLRERSLSGHTAVLLLGEESEVAALLPYCAAGGFLCMERSKLDLAFPQLLAMCNRLHAMQIRENSLQKKLGDEKLVNRAKLLLISRLQMSETEAHRYIEKTAMDTGDSRREVALRLIRTYEE